jgi:hypothetical protein
MAGSFNPMHWKENREDYSGLEWTRTIKFKLVNSLRSKQLATSKSLTG